MHSVDDLVLSLVDFIGHMSKYIDQFDGRYGIGQRNYEGKISAKIIM